MPPFRERDTLRFPNKNYRLSAETRVLLEAILRSRPRDYLTFDELFMDLADRLLRRDRTLEAEVERYLREHGFRELADRRAAARKSRIEEEMRRRGINSPTASDKAPDMPTAKSDRGRTKVSSPSQDGED